MGLVPPQVGHDERLEVAPLSARTESASAAACLGKERQMSEKSFKWFAAVAWGSEKNQVYPD
jgi:hypothetical protein